MLPQISYVPTDWKDEVPGEDPVTYDIQGLTAGKTIVPHVAPAAGTPVNATNLNNIETGLAAAIAGVNQVLGGSPVLLASIISSAYPDEFDFSSIPAGFKNLCLSGVLKLPGTTSFSAAMPVVIINGDAGANYYYVNDAGHKVGPNSTVTVADVVKSFPADAGLVTPFELRIAEYDSMSVLKWIIHRGITYNNAENPIDAPLPAFYANVWTSTAAVNRIQVKGTFIADISHLELYGVPIL